MTIIKETVATLFEGHEGPCAIKDPQITWLLPMYRHIFPEAKIIFALRNPIDTAKSLLISNQIPFNEGVKYWERVLKHAMKYTAGAKCFYVFYEDLLPSSIYQAGRIASFMGLKKDTLDYSDQLH